VVDILMIVDPDPAPMIDKVIALLPKLIDPSVSV
jgi:hypothetical protein